MNEALLDEMKPTGIPAKVRDASVEAGTIEVEASVEVAFLID